MTLSSDKLSGLRRPLAAVRLSIASSAPGGAPAQQSLSAVGVGEDETPLYFEMDQQELGQFIKTLKSAQKVLLDSDRG